MIAFADEEGAYISLSGSRAMTGSLTAGEVETARRRDGAPLHEAMRGYGLDPMRIVDAERSNAEIAAYVELHIEQGPVLEAAGRDIGIVTDIVGLHTSEVLFRGEANHAGTTPLHLRKDAMRVAEIETGARVLFRALDGLLHQTAT